MSPVGLAWGDGGAHFEIGAFWIREGKVPFAERGPGSGGGRPIDRSIRRADAELKSLWLHWGVKGVRKFRVR